MQGNITSGCATDPDKLLDPGMAATGIPGKRLELGAPVTGSVPIQDSVAVSFGDGAIRFFSPALDPTMSQAPVSRTHGGVVLCMAANAEAVLSGGDDGRLMRTSIDGEVQEVANFGTKWVDTVAASHDLIACSSERNVYLWSKGRDAPLKLEHRSSVGGLAFDASGRRLAVAHYGGVTIWENTKRRWKSSALVWKGFHGAISFSPDGKYVVTAMQENSLHGWRLRDKGHLAMSGYPAKVKSFAWVGHKPFLATSGADTAVCWPFDGKFGPMERNPVCVAHNRNQLATCVQSLEGQDAVFAGFRDGTVLLAAIDEREDPIIIRNATGAEVTAITISASGSHILIGDAHGGILWAPLWSEGLHARNV